MQALEVPVSRFDRECLEIPARHGVAQPLVCRVQILENHFQIRWSSSGRRRCVKQLLPRTFEPHAHEHLPISEPSLDVPCQL
jgi:hypothetical protein